MRKAGGIVALIAGIFGFFAAVITIFFGGLGSVISNGAWNNGIGVGFSGLFICLSIIVLSAIAINSKTFIPGILIIIASISGAIFGGILVAILMLLSLVGGVLACVGNGDFNNGVASVETEKFSMDTLIVVLCTAGLFLIVFWNIANPNKKLFRSESFSDSYVRSEFSANKMPGIDETESTPNISTVIDDETEVPETVDTAAIAESESKEPNEVFPLISYAGKPPLEVLNDEIFRENSKNLIGSHYEKFTENFTFSDLTDMDHKYILGFGCKEEICQKEQAAFAIERKNRQMIAVLITEDGDYFFGVEKSDDLPGNLQSWYSTLKNTQMP